MILSNISRLMTSSVEPQLVQTWFGVPQHYRCEHNFFSWNTFWVLKRLQVFLWNKGSFYHTLLERHADVTGVTRASRHSANYPLQW